MPHGHAPGLLSSARSRDEFLHWLALPSICTGDPGKLLFGGRVSDRAPMRSGDTPDRSLSERARRDLELLLPRPALCGLTNP